MEEVAAVLSANQSVRFLYFSRSPVCNISLGSCGKTGYVAIERVLESSLVAIVGYGLRLWFGASAAPGIG
jgi:hypothetical protein